MLESCTEDACLMGPDDQHKLPDPASDLAELKLLTADVLSFDGLRGILTGLVMELVEILERSADLATVSEEAVTAGETSGSEGLAISPAQAALCADEPIRTAVFLRGVHDAISKALLRRVVADHPIHVIYAGSGPYATLCIPLMTLFPPEDVRFTILDLHELSIRSVKTIVRRLQLGQSVAGYVVGDACQYSISKGEIPAVIVSETMDAALETEPQVAIMRHLARQAPEALLVPESVQVDAVLLDTSSEPKRIEPDRGKTVPASSPDRIMLGRVFSLDAEAIKSWSGLESRHLPAFSVVIPSAPTPDYRPFLFTTIVAHGDHVLRTHDCGLTSPRAFPGNTKSQAGATIHFVYRLGERPGLEINEKSASP